MQSSNHFYNFLSFHTRDFVALHSNAIGITSRKLLFVEPSCIKLSDFFGWIDQSEIMVVTNRVSLIERTPGIQPPKQNSSKEIPTATIITRQALSWWGDDNNRVN